MTDKILPIIKKIRNNNPVILNIANSVTQQHVADAINYIGASPIMFDDPNEAEDLMQVADGLSINLGTPNDHVFKKALLAGKKANQAGKPILVDPVAVSASATRQKFFTELSQEIDFSLIRGNAAEIAAICKQTWKSRGIDDNDQNANTADKIALAVRAAKTFACAVFISGQKDIISDGRYTFVVSNGNSQLKTNVGSGDMLDGILTSALAVENSLASAASASAILSISAEIAADKYPDKPMSFLVELFDQLAKIDDDIILKKINLSKNTAI